MTTRTLTGRAIEVPDLVGVKADQAIQRLRELGLMPTTWSAAVDDVNEAGFVLGIDPPPGSPVRPKTHITMSVATHPDFQGHVDDTLAGEPEKLVQPPLTWPLSGPTGFAAPAPASPSEALTDAFATAATPGQPSAPASPPLDAAYREIRHHDAAASSVGEPTPGVAADPYSNVVSAPVPTPDEISADAEWDGLRAAEAARHADGHPASRELETPPAAPEPAVDTADETVLHDSADALEEQARREARRRRARRHRRLTLKQKAIVAGVLAVTLVVIVVVAAKSGRTPVVHPARTAHTARHRPARAKSAVATVHHKRAKTAPATVHHKAADVRRRRVITVRKRDRTHVVTVTVNAPASTTSHTDNTTPAVPVSAGPSGTAAPSTGAGGPPTTTPGATSAPAAPTPSHKPASTPSGSGSSGTGGGSTLQSPGGATAPPKP